MSALAEHPLAQAVGWALLHFLWEGALVALAMALGLRLLRFRSAQTRYLFACTGFLAMAALPIATFALLPHAAAAPASVEWLHRQGGGLPAGGPAQMLRQAQVALAPVLPWALGIWCLGVSLLSLRMLGAWFWLQGLRFRQATPAGAEWHLRLSTLQRRLGLHQTVELLKSAAVDVPMVIGWFRPVILVPASAFLGLTPEALEAVLAHELAHIRRHDYLVNLFQSVIEILLFYHPAVWWLSAQIRTERENCCDDVAVAYCGDALAYAKALADLEGLRAPVSFRTELALAADGGSLMNRIKRLILPSLPPSPRKRVGLLAALAVSALGAGTLVHLKEDTPKPKEIKGTAAKKTTRIVLNEDGRKLTVNSTGKVELNPDSAEMLTLGEGASFELHVSGAGQNKTFRIDKDAKGGVRSYQEDAGTKAYDAPLQPWLREELKKVQQAQAKAPVTPRIPGEPGEKVIVLRKHANGTQDLEKRIVIDTEKITKDVERHMKEFERHQGEMGLSRKEMERAEKELKRAEKEMGRAHKEMARHKVLVLKDGDLDEAIEDGTADGIEDDPKGGVEGATPRAHIVVKRIKGGGGVKQEAEILRSTIENLQARLDRLEEQEEEEDAEETPKPPARPRTPRPSKAPRAPKAVAPPPPPPAPHAPTPAPHGFPAPPAPPDPPAPPSPAPNQEF